MLLLRFNVYLAIIHKSCFPASEIHWFFPKEFCLDPILLDLLGISLYSLSLPLHLNQCNIHDMHIVTSLVKTVQASLKI